MGKTPHKVLDAFKPLIDLYGNKVEYLGAKSGTEYYLFPFPDNIETGFPQVVAYKDETAVPVVGFDAVKIVSLFNPKN